MIQTTERTDEQLAARAAEGDQQAVADLFERYFDRVYDLAMGMVRNRETAADIAQSTFVKVMEHLRKSRPPQAFRAWLYTIARNTALDELRRSKRVAPALTVITDEGDELQLEPEAPAEWAEPERVVADEETVKLVWDATAGLSPDDHALLDLHLRKGLEPGEIAAVLGSAPGAVYTRLSRLRGALEASVVALMLYRRRRECEELDGVVAKYAEPGLTPNLRKAINRHLEQCDRCQERRRGLVPAGALFGAVPLFVAPPEVRAGALAAAVRAGGGAEPPAPGSGSGPGAPAWAKAALGLAAAAAIFTAGWWAAAARTAPAAAEPEREPAPPAAVTPLTVTALRVPTVSRSTALTVEATAAGDVTGWLLSEEGTAPAQDDPRWQAAPPDRFELPPGDGHRYLFLWVRDGAGQVAGRGAGLLLDTTPPPAPAALAQTAGRSPGAVTVSWAPPLDPMPGSGLAGYAIAWSTGAEPTAEAMLDAGFTQAVSPELSPGEWFFLITPIDQAGNRGETARLGPIMIRPPVEASPAPAEPRAEAVTTDRLQPVSRP